MATGAAMLEQVRAAGVIGAGGAGFPSHVKLAAQAEVVIANGAECEPLVHVDQELMIHHTDRVVRGLELVVEMTGAQRGVLGVKKKYGRAIAALTAAIAGKPHLSICELGNFYPAGDEQVLVYDVLGRVVPEGGIPIQVGVVVQNIESLINVANAVDYATPVTHKYLTIAGDVRNPITLRVPIGITLQQAIDLAGGARPRDFVVLNGGAMMGSVALDLNAPVTKTTKLLIILARDHYLSQIKLQSAGVFTRRAISSCDQCFMCTDFCPRHAIGHAIQPHKIIKLISAGVPITEPELAIAFLCCECKTCNYACPVHLLPGNIASQMKHDLLKAGFKNPYHRETTPDPNRDLHRVPINRLIARLHLAPFDVAAPLDEETRRFSQVRLPLKQHVGAPVNPVVKAGDRVRVGDLLGEIPDGALGARIHASVDGVVSEVSHQIVIDVL